MNEPNGINATVAYNLNQAAINAIRASNATTQLILVEGTGWTGAHSWYTTGNAAAFTSITDPNDNWAVQFHEYLDADYTGTHAACVDNAAERLAPATKWLTENGLRGFLGEFRAGNSSKCISGLQTMLCTMLQSDLWIGALWWGAGSWKPNYFMSMEPPNGYGIAEVLPQALLPFV